MPSELALSGAPLTAAPPSSPSSVPAGICQNYHSHVTAAPTAVVFGITKFIYASTPVLLVKFHPSSFETQLKTVGVQQKAVLPNVLR